MALEPLVEGILRGRLAHPTTTSFGLPVSPLVAALALAAIVVAVAFAVPRGAAARPVRSSRSLTSWEGSLTLAQVATRAFAVAALALAIVAGRLGVDDELENLAPALVVGSAWPLLVLASALVGPVWRWFDPWDGATRALSERAARSHSPDPVPDQTIAEPSVWPAAIVVLPWVWYLSAYPTPLSPRSVGAFVALYSVATLVGCLALGRERWLPRAEPLGILLSWTACLPTRRLAGWQPPPGAEALLGVLAGGVLFGAVRRSELWGGLNAVPGAVALATAAVVVSSALGALALVSLARRAAAASRGSVARAGVPAVAAIVVAVSMEQNRLTTSAQLLPGLIGDPLGRGWDLLGPSAQGLSAAPLGTDGLVLAQVLVLLLGHLVGAIHLARTHARVDREPAAGALGILAIASVFVLVSH